MTARPLWHVYLEEAAEDARAYLRCRTPEGRADALERAEWSLNEAHKRLPRG